MKFKEIIGTIAKAGVIGGVIYGIYYGWALASQLYGPPAGPMSEAFFAIQEVGQQIAIGVALLAMAVYIFIKIVS